MRELLQTRNRAFGPNGVPTTSRQTSATRTDTTSRLPISPGSTNKRYEPSTHPDSSAKARPACYHHSRCGAAGQLPNGARVFVRVLICKIAVAALSLRELRRDGP